MYPQALTFRLYQRPFLAKVTDSTRTSLVASDLNYLQTSPTLAIVLPLLPPNSVCVRQPFAATDSQIAILEHVLCRISSRRRILEEASPSQQQQSPPFLTSTHYRPCPPFVRPGKSFEGTFVPSSQGKRARNHRPLGPPSFLQGILSASCFRSNVGRSEATREVVKGQLRAV